MEGSSLSSRIITTIKGNLVVSALISVGLICLLIGLIQYFAPVPQQIEFKSAESVMSASASASSEIFVDVSGEVDSPGVYTLASDARLQDALRAAGGLSADADREYVSKSLNLASKLHDGVKIYIPRVGEENIPVAVAEGRVSMNPASGVPSINSSSQSELEELPGVGPVTAQKIIENRPYTSLEELVSKKSVGQSLFGKIKDQISL